MLRHYSSASLTVRLASVVQGIGILVAWAVALTQRNFLLAVSLPVAGLLFTFFLHRFHLGYFQASKVFSKAAAKMEEDFSADFRPISAHSAWHDNNFQGIRGKLLGLNAPFALIGILFVCALVVSCIALALTNKQPLG